MRGMVASKSMIRRVTERLRELIDSDLDMMRAPLKGKEVDPGLVEQVDQAIEHCFKGSLRGILDFMDALYLGRARADPGCKALRNGAEVYAHCLHFHTTTAKTAQEIHELGLQEVARIEFRFQRDVLDHLEFKGTF